MRQSIISTFITAIAMSACATSAAHASTGNAVAGMALSASNAEAAPADNTRYTCQRPKEADRLFVSDAIEKKIREVKRLIRENARLAWMFENCFPNTLDTTVQDRKSVV